MACVGVVGVHAPARVRVDANRDRRALGMTRAKLGDARVRSSGVGISGIASRENNELRKLFDATRRRERALQVKREPPRRVMASSDEQELSKEPSPRISYVPRKENPEVRGETYWIERGVELVCSECEATETSRWFKNRERPDEPVCMACYNRQLAATRGKCCKCGKDGKDTSGMQKSKHNEGEWICDRCAHRELPFDGCTCDACGRGASDGVRSWKLKNRPWLCGNCYGKERLILAEAEGTKCLECGTDMTGYHWHLSKRKPGAKICRACYRNAKISEATAAGMTCGECGTDTTSTWLNSKLDPGAKICYACYQKAKMSEATAAGITCGECGTDTTSKWYNSKLDPGAKICNACHQKAKISRAKAAGMTCGECGTDTTSKWLSSNLVPGAKICLACYLKARRGKKKAERS